MVAVTVRYPPSQQKPNARLRLGAVIACEGANSKEVPHLTSSYTMQRTAGVRIRSDF